MKIHKKWFIVILTIGSIGAIYILMKKQIEIHFVTSQKYRSQDIEFTGGLNSFEWFIISNEVQRINLIEEGYNIPYVDFKKNNLIISRYKIRKLYMPLFFKRKSNGLPVGEVLFDKKHSNSDYYYFYLMPKIHLSQSVG